MTYVKCSYLSAASNISFTNVECEVSCILLKKCKYKIRVISACGHKKCLASYSSSFLFVLSV